jgi:nucleoside-diphosphate kinase
MSIQRTLSILKPDVVRRNITGEVNAVIEASGFSIIAQKMIHMSKEQAKGFYAVHKDRPFFGELVDYISSYPVVVQVLEKENAVEDYRTIMGATNPDNALEGTIRKMFAISIGENSVHGSDSLENAEKEISFFFQDGEICPR